MRIGTIAVVIVLAGCLLRGGNEEGRKTSQPITPAGAIPLPNVQGRIDHFALDPRTNRLFVAALGNNTLEVIDLPAGKVSGRIEGLAAPQGVSAAPDVNRLAVANDRDGSVRLYELDSLKPVATTDLKSDADNVRYEPQARRFWVGHGDGALAALDAQTGKQLVDIKLEGHPESFQLEARGRRIFVNVPKAGHVAVIDREKPAVVARWELKDAGGNFPMGLDEVHHRLFVGCRKPARMLVLDTDSGKVVASLEIVGDTDDLFYDGTSSRIYAAGGEGHVSIIQQKDADRYEPAGEVRTAPGARTAFFVERNGMLYVAAPRRGSQEAEIRVFRTSAQ